MLELEDVLTAHGLSIENVSQIEDKYYTYQKLFLENDEFTEILKEIELEIFKKFCSHDADVAKEAYYEMQGLLRIKSKLQQCESEYLKVQAIKESNGENAY